MLNRLVFGTVCAGAALLCPTLAAAEGPEPLLLLGVVRNGRVDSALSARLSEHLAHVGESLVHAPHLSTAERLCTDQECMEATGLRTGAARILTVQITAERQAAPYVRLALLETRLHRPVHREGVCEPCSADRLGGLVESLTDQALAAAQGAGGRESDAPTAAASPASRTPDRDPTDAIPSPAMTAPPARMESASAPETAAAAQVSVAITPMVAVPAVTAARVQPGWLESVPRSRRIGAAILAGAGVASLVAGIALSVTHTQYTSLPCSLSESGPSGGLCRLDNSLPMGLSYAAAGVAITASALLLAWPAGSTPAMRPSAANRAAVQER